MNSVSCPLGTSFCMALGDGSYYTANGTTWTGTSSPAPGGPLHGFTYSVSCATASFCVAVDWEGNALVGTG